MKMMTEKMGINKGLTHAPEEMSELKTSPKQEVC